MNHDTLHGAAAPADVDRASAQAARAQGASGNGGRFGGSANLEEFMRWQWVTERDEPATYPF